jgi:hypothetical protein
MTTVASFASRASPRESDGGDRHHTTMAPLGGNEMSTPRMIGLEGGAGGNEREPASPLNAPNRVETLAWRDLSYYYKTKGGKEGESAGERAAVKQCTGVVHRGDMVAVMGALE